MFGDINIIGYITCVPIIVSSDSLGLFIVVDKNNNYLNLAKLGAKILVENLDI